MGVDYQPPRTAPRGQGSNMNAGVSEPESEGTAGRAAALLNSFRAWHIVAPPNGIALLPCSEKQPVRGKEARETK
jgi:hypothetical protein